MGEDANATGDLDVTGPLEILGAGAAVTIIDAGGIDRVLDVRPGGALRTGGRRDHGRRGARRAVGGSRDRAGGSRGRAWPVAPAAPAKRAAACGPRAPSPSSAAA